MTPPPWVKDGKCPHCKHPMFTEESNELGGTFDYMTMVTGPKIEMVLKCNECNGKYIVSSEPLRSAGVT